MDRETEVRLLEGLRRGDERAFDEIYAEYRPRIFTFVLGAVAFWFWKVFRTPSRGKIKMMEEIGRVTEQVRELGQEQKH